MLIDQLVGAEHPVTRYITSIGRSPGCDLRLDDRSISRQHAAIYMLRDEYYLEDFDSMNGTAVNGVTVKGTRVKINAGDEIRLGLTCLTFMLIPDRSASPGFSSRSVANADEDQQITTCDLGNPVFGTAFQQAANRRELTSTR